MDPSREGQSMTRYLVLIRGINVGGIVLKMDDLKALMAEFGFEKIRTYIQSGNAIFESDSDDVRELALRIKDIIRSRMGLEIEAFVKTKADLERMLDSLPFGDYGGKKLYITVLGDRPEADRVDELRSLNTDAEKIAVVGDTAYIRGNQIFEQLPAKEARSALHHEEPEYYEEIAGDDGGLRGRLRRPPPRSWRILQGRFGSCPNPPGRWIVPVAMSS